MAQLLLQQPNGLRTDVEQRQNKVPDILSVIDIKQCSASVLKHIVEKYGSQLITDFDVSQRFTAAALSDAAKWQEPGPGTGYEVIVLGGQSNMEYNTQTWTINLITGHTVEKSCLPVQVLSLFAPAMCSTSKGALIAGGGSRRSAVSSYIPNTQCVLYVTEENMWSVLPDLPTAVMGGGAACIDTKVYIIGGCRRQR